uniref:Fibronectin type-III domain-containing protein n=1 Tax=Schistocephalus solidus TaxID=70667 RepID=A0A0X3NKH9_SCHSO
MQSIARLKIFLILYGIFLEYSYINATALESFIIDRVDSSYLELSWEKPDQDSVSLTVIAVVFNSDYVHYASTTADSGRVVVSGLQAMTRYKVTLLAENSETKLCHISPQVSTVETLPSDDVSETSEPTTPEPESETPDITEDVSQESNPTTTAEYTTSETPSEDVSQVSNTTTTAEYTTSSISSEDVSQESNPSTTTEFTTSTSSSVSSGATSSVTEKTTSTPAPTKLSSGQIAGITVGVLLAAILIILTVVFFVKVVKTVV